MYFTTGVMAVGGSVTLSLSRSYGAVRSNSWEEMVCECPWDTLCSLGTGQGSSRAPGPALPPFLSVGQGRAVPLMKWVNAAMPGWGCAGCTGAGKVSISPSWPLPMSQWASFSLRLCLRATIRCWQEGNKSGLGNKGKAPFWGCNPTATAGHLQAVGSWCGRCPASLQVILGFGDAALSSAGEFHRSFRVALLYSREKPNSWQRPQCSGAFLSAELRVAKHSESQIPLPAAWSCGKWSGRCLERHACSSPEFPKAGSGLLMGILFCLTRSQNHLLIKNHAFPWWSFLVLTWALIHTVVNSPSVMQGQVIYKIFLLWEAW